MMAELLRVDRGMSLVYPTMGWMSENEQKGASGKRKSITGKGHKEQDSGIESSGGCDYKDNGRAPSDPTPIRTWISENEPETASQTDKKSMVVDQTLYP